MKLAIILDTLATARLPAVTGEQLLSLVGTAEGKAFAADLKRFAAGETQRHDQLAAVVHALAPALRGAVKELGYQFDLRTLIAAAKLDRSSGIKAIIKASERPDKRAQAVAFLRRAGLQVIGGTERSAPAVPTEPPYYSFKIFGNSAALCISEARTRAGNQYTIQVEGAVGAAVSGTKSFDWRSVMIVQLTKQECYLTLALFENKIASLRFDGHGDRHDKSLHIDYQERHYFVRMTKRGKAAVAVQVRPADALQIVSLLYKQIRLNDPHLEIDQIRAFTDQLAQMTNTTTV
ncbi:hypothetical protein [Massilia sp. PWRC2]|uniref:hypothetical protein n=1 Tax=Massilia sp. PWRC2 TaxID=2804626 RepID=UPI003CE713FB